MSEKIGLFVLSKLKPNPNVFFFDIETQYCWERSKKKRKTQLYHSIARNQHTIYGWTNACRRYHCHRRNANTKMHLAMTEESIEKNDQAYFSDTMKWVSVRALHFQTSKSTDNWTKKTHKKCNAILCTQHCTMIHTFLESSQHNYCTFGTVWTLTAVQSKQTT